MDHRPHHHPVLLLRRRLGRLRLQQRLWLQQWRLRLLSRIARPRTLMGTGTFFSLYKKTGSPAARASLFVYHSNTRTRITLGICFTSSTTCSPTLVLRSTMV